MWKQKSGNKSGSWLWLFWISIPIYSHFPLLSLYNVLHISYASLRKERKEKFGSSVFENPGWCLSFFFGFISILLNSFSLILFSNEAIAMERSLGISNSSTGTLVCSNVKYMREKKKYIYKKSNDRFVVERMNKPLEQESWEVYWLFALNNKEPTRKKKNIKKLPF